MKKWLLPLAIAHTVWALSILCIYRLFSVMLFLCAFSPMAIILLYALAEKIIKSKERENFKPFLSEKLFAYIVLFVTVIGEVPFWINKSIAIHLTVFSLFSLSPFILFCILLWIIWSHARYNPDFDEADRTSYNMFEHALLPGEIKVMYQESNGLMKGFLPPIFLFIFFFEGPVKLWSIFLFFVAVLGGLVYGRYKLKPLLTAKRKKEKEELVRQLKKEQGYH